jgi:hypothetical protein
MTPMSPRRFSASSEFSGWAFVTTAIPLNPLNALNRIGVLGAIGGLVVVLAAYQRPWNLSHAAPSRMAATSTVSAFRMPGDTGCL